MKASSLFKDCADELIEFLDKAPDFVMLRNPDGTILMANETLCQRLGVPREKLIGRSIYDFYIDPKQKPISQKYTETLLRQGSNQITLLMRDKNGSPVEVEVRGCQVIHKGKKILFGIGREIGRSERDQRLAEVLRTGFRTSHDIMFYTGPNGMILDINDAFTDYYGYTREEAIGKTPGFLRSQYSTDEFYQHMWKKILDPKNGFWRGEIINRTKDGREIPLILTISAARDHSGKVVGFISSATDIHKSKELEEKIAQTQALADLGEMAAAVAHEIRNPLSSISMASKQLLQSHLGLSDKESIVKILEHESQRLNKILNELLLFARPRTIKRKSSDLNSLIKTTANLITQNQDLASGIKLTLSLNPNLYPFLFDSDQILQVLWNMILNAIQAMEGKGTLTIRSGQSENFAYFAIGDTGNGISEEEKTKIFKPFHSTKSQGVGLGLPTAKRIVVAHGGRIEVDTRLGQGTVFTVWLPYLEN